MPRHAAGPVHCFLISAYDHSWHEALVLLCHKLLSRCDCWQHGHRMSVLALALAMARQIVVIELLTCRSGLIGGTSGSITAG